ncbi:MAG: acetyl-CoA C-acyltransferase [Chloroflexi bacterium]|jgi:acetyl-CoA C-acetyltransferase|nr:acetyl-CoA C-acyltransferase [Chloroflexota bacterium]
MTTVAIISAARTPIGNFGGALKDISAVELGEIAARAAILRAGLTPDRIDETIFGSARHAGNGPNMARQIAYRSQIPVEKLAFTVNMACGSGLKAILLGAQSIMLGENQIVLAGGIEQMSQIPYLLMKARWGYRLGNDTLVDSNVQDGYFCPMSDMLMGETVDRLAEELGISRAEQDAFTVESHRRASAAWENGDFTAEVVPVEVPGRKGTIWFERDERPRADSTVEKLATMTTVFRPAEEGGTITAANASGITDAGAAVILMTADLAKSEGIQPMAVIRGFASAGVEPTRMGLSPIPATHKVMAQTGTTLNDFGLIELNEAFAAQVLMVERELNWDPALRNINGGAVALGHPTGCTGARMMVTLLHAMQKRAAELGLATLCISGGLGLSIVVER